MASSSTPSLEEAVNSMRDNILRTQSQCSTAAITSFDNMVNQLKIFAQQINDKTLEITRLQELCKKNNIEYAIAPVATVPAKTIKPKN